MMTREGKTNREKWSRLFEIVLHNVVRMVVCLHAIYHAIYVRVYEVYVIYVHL